MSKIRLENAVELGQFLAKRRPEPGPNSETVFYCQRAARIIHRHDERRCNEDLTCPRCQGGGCEKCAQGGDTLSRADARLLTRLRETLKPYRLRVYEQGDPRGWPLYLIPEESGPESEDDSNYNSRGFAVCPH